MSIVYNAETSNRGFYIPPTLASDFSNFLNHDVPNMVMDFQLYKDWYDQFDEEYDPTIIRGEIYPNSTKSRYQNTDNNLNFRADVASGIQKGDIIQDSSGNTYLLDWNVLLEHNNAPSRALKCNARLEFTRHMSEAVDDMGYLINDAEDVIIADAIPCNAYRYDGRPEWSVSSGMVGLTPNALCIVSIQYNSKTKHINIDDEFYWGNTKYVVIDLNYMGCDMDVQYGVISIQAKKKAGGEL